MVQPSHQDSVVEGRWAKIAEPVGAATFSAPINITGTTNQTNTATVAPPAGTVDPVSGNNSATAGVLVTAAPCCLAISNVVVTPNAVPAGGAFTVQATITETCGAPSVAGTAVITGLPGTITGSTTQPYGAMAGSGATVMTWNFTNTDNTAATLNGNVTATTALVGCPAPVPFSFTTLALVIPQADLAITKQITPSTFITGSTTSGTVTLVVTNNGPAAANGAIVTDNIA